jgi:hypothetical protein
MPPMTGKPNVRASLPSTLDVYIKTCPVADSRALKRAWRDSSEPRRIRGTGPYTGTDEEGDNGTFSLPASSSSNPSSAPDTRLHKPWEDSWFWSCDPNGRSIVGRRPKILLGKRRFTKRKTKTKTKTKTNETWMSHECMSNHRLIILSQPRLGQSRHSRSFV